MMILAQTPVDGIQALFNLVPLGRIANLFNAVMPAFVLVAVVMLLAGYTMHLAAHGEPFHVSGRLGVLFAVLVSSLWLIQTGQQIANALVAVIASLDPALAWLVVPNPGDDSLSMNFGQVFVTIGRYVAGSWQGSPAWPWELFRWSDYAWRLIAVGLTGIFAWVTMFLMEATLLIQKLILIGSRPFVPIFVAGLFLPSVQGSAQNFFKGLCGVMCFPVGWALAHVVTMAMIQGLQSPAWGGPPGAVLFAVVQLMVICLWMVIATAGAPAAILFTVYNGTNFVGRLGGSMVSAASQHAANLTRSGAKVGGAIAGLPGGPAGVAIGAQVGSMVGNVAASPFSSLAQGASSISGHQHPVPNSRSAAAADAAIRSLRKRS
jgi:hypothetical protein